MNPQLILIFALFGLGYGIILQRSGFCFSKAAFELFYLRSRDSVNGVMVGLVLATVGFAAVTLWRERAGLATTPHLLLLPAGFSTVLGGLLFGIGMTVAGMCAVGTLQRMGEGHGIAWAVFAGVLAGAVSYPFRHLFSGWDPGGAPALSIGDWFGPLFGFALTLLILGGMWAILLRPARRAPSSAQPPAPRLRSWVGPAVLGGAALALLNTAQMAVAVPWTAGYPLAMLPSALSWAPTASLASMAAPLALNAGLIFGAALSSLLQRDFRFTWPRSRRDLVVAAIGGLLMGWGIRAGHACNIGGVFSSIPSLALSGWLYLVGLVPGAWLGTKIVVRLR
jgi:uncharacterized membrane protein YedE/YeeE